MTSPYFVMQGVCTADSLHHDWKGESEHILEAQINLLSDISESAKGGRELQQFLRSTCLEELRQYWTGDCRLPAAYHTEQEWGSKIKALIIFSPIILESLRGVPLSRLLIK